MGVPAIRWMYSTGARKSARVLLSCRIKHGVSPWREGISAVTSEHVEVSVTNQARDGAANKSARVIIARALQMPISDITLRDGQNSRDKTFAINIHVRGKPEAKVDFVRSVILANVMPSEPSPQE